MNKIKSIAGIIWAIITIFIVLATFMGNDYFSRKLASAIDIAISPWFSGGEILKTIDHGTYKTIIHRPVFDALICEKRQGFIQLNWEPFAGLPPVIHEGIDYDDDNRDDFFITLNTKTGDASLKKYNATVLSVEQSYKLKKGWAVRVLTRGA